MEVGNATKGCFDLDCFKKHTNGASDELRRFAIRNYIR